MEINKINESHQTWAHDIESNLVHISKARSGKKGYFCIGCKREMIAVVNFKDPSHKQYYRHDVTGEHEVKCTYSDETTRHRIAKEILQRLREIKVPPIYSYPPEGTIGQPILIQKEKYINAASVEVERYFYEDENGRIKWETKGEFENSGRHYLIKPDVIFFNNKNEPILFIELVAHHKITHEKREKIKRLGIDTIQVRLPVESAEEIEKTFKVIERTKWVYNYDQESANYIPVSKTYGEAISSIDEIQARLLEETLACRSAEIRNLIFAINRCLESESYRTVEGGFKRELLRVAHNTETERQRAERLQAEADRAIAEQFNSEMEELEAAERTIAKEELKFRTDYRTMEERYLKEKTRIESEERFIRERIDVETGGDGFTGTDLERRIREVRRQTASVEGEIDAETEAIRQLESNISAIPGKLEQEEAVFRNQIAELEKREERAIEQIRNSIKELPGRFRELQTELDNNLERRRREDVSRIKARDGNGDGELSRSIKRLLETWRRVNDYKDSFIRAKRYRFAYECFKQGHYKNWPEYRRISGMGRSK